MAGGAGGGTAALALVLLTAVVAVTGGVRAEVLGYTDTVWLDRQGPLKGLITTVGGGGDRRLDQVEIYLGVPYAASQERFMPPGESPTWCPKADDGSFDRSHCRPLRAEYLKPVCPQRSPDLLMANTNKRLSAVRSNYLRRLTPYLGNQSEDCLYLNIYAPHGRLTAMSPFVIAIPETKFSFTWRTDERSRHTRGVQIQNGNGTVNFYTLLEYVGRLLTERCTRRRFS